MDKHTPGPWTVEKCRCGHRSCDRYGTSNGQFYQGCGYSLQDAHLIAAAPTMYEFVASKAQSGDNEALNILEGIHGNAKRN